MYKIDDVDEKLLTEHLNVFQEKAQILMVEFRDGQLEFKGHLGTKNIIKITYKVAPNSPTWKFLNKYSQPVELKKLLCGSWEEMLEIIDDINSMMEDEIWKGKLTKEKYSKRQYQSTQTLFDGTMLVDSFNDILYHIFVEELYEKVLDKYQFIKNMNLMVCPYCGRQRINVASLPGKRPSKPPIDHFLPKRKYPFLAVSFYNLIPCCTNCNELANKGDFDPLEGDLGLENPHDFVDNHVLFKGEFPDFDNEMAYEKYTVTMSFNPSSLAKGYKETLKLEAFYQEEQQTMMDMYSNMIHLSESRKDFLKTLGVSGGYLDNIQRSVLGFPLDGKTSVRLFYKFKKELFEQLLAKFHLHDK